MKIKINNNKKNILQKCKNAKLAIKDNNIITQRERERERETKFSKPVVMVMNMASNDGGLTLKNISFKSGFGWFHEAMASQKKTKSLTTPPGLRLIR